MPMSTKCQKNEKKTAVNVIQHYDIYDRFTIEHFPLRQRMTLTTKIYCSHHTLFGAKMVLCAQLFST
jgi:hypothetical protein